MLPKLSYLKGSVIAGASAMYEITVTIPEEPVAALQTSCESVGDEMLLAAAVKLYELDRLSSGAAAQLAGISRAVFLARLADYGVATFRLLEAELVEDWANA
jgi:predicted HTH domain antitoxin